MEQRPNVVLFISHDTGRFLSPYGYTTVHSPRFEALAAESLMFTNAWCTSPLCAPSRSALVTGQPPHQNGMMGLPDLCLGDWDMRAKERHLAAVLGKAGYRTALCGFEHESQDCLSLGFDQAFHGSGNRHNGGQRLKGIGNSIDRWLENLDKDRPFYLQIGCHETHRKWTEYSEPYSDDGIWKAPYLIDDPSVDTEMAEMQGAVKALDDGIDEIMGVFKKRGLDQDTLFIFTTDHGIDFPRAKGTMFDPGLEVFLFIRYPAGGIPVGAVSPHLVSHIDLYPTILEYCRVPVPPETSGRSLRGLMMDIAGGNGDRSVDESCGSVAGTAAALCDAVFFEKTYHDNYDPIRGLRTERYKYIMNFDAQTLYDVRISTAPRYNWFRFPFKKYTVEELYDLQNDPDETRNLAKDDDSQELLAQLRRRLARWMAETKDPLLEGPIPSPYHLRMSAAMKTLATQPE